MLLKKADTSDGHDNVIRHIGMPHLLDQESDLLYT